MRIADSISRLTVAIFVFCCFLNCGLAQNTGGKESWKGRPVVIELRDDDFAESKMLRELEKIVTKAEQEEAAAIIYVLEFDASLGGTGGRSIPGKVVNSNLPSFALIESSAIGTGAIMALATDIIYMGPSGIVGGAAIESLEESEKEKSKKSVSQQQSILKARARSLAAKNGHRVDVAEAFIDAQIEIKADWGIVSAKGEVLTLTAEEAVKLDKGKPLLAKGIVESVSDLLATEKLSGDPVTITPRSFGENFNRERLTQVAKKEQGSKGKEKKDDSLFGRREEGSYSGKVVVLKVGDDTLATGKASFDFMDRTLKKAELDGAAAVVFDMDTPGGFAWYTEGLVLNSLQNVSIPTYTFVNTRAESAGAIIAMGTDHIFMRPAATIGSALVVSGSGGDLSESMEDKVTQMMIGTVRNIAELKGHNPDVAEAFVTRNKEVKIDGEVIHEAGNVLNLNTIRATEKIGGRPVLAKGVANSIEDIVKSEKLNGEILSAKPLGMESFAHWVQKLSVLLIVVGLAGAYTEINSPGFGLPGLISVCVFSLFFFGNYLAGNLAGYELAVLLVLGLVLIAIEVFLFPGAIVPGAVGAALVLMSLGLAMVDRVDLEWKWSGLPGGDTWITIFQGSFMALALGLVGALGAVLLGMRFLPQTRLGSRLILQEAVASGGSIEQPELEGMKESYVGLTGEAMTDLLPSGKGEFGGKYVDIVSDGEFIEKGEPVKVIQHEGPRIVVTRV
tara:strand:- start:3728 stop:5923 length:2196 start_codon:yes stop_codon:yes gene_type:complete